MCVCTHVHSHFFLGFHGDPEERRQLLIGSIWYPAQCLSHSGGLSKYMLSRWNRICQIILLSREDSYQASLLPKLMLLSLKSDFPSLWFFICRDDVQCLFFHQALSLQLMKRMIRQTHTVLALKWLSHWGDIDQQGQNDVMME